MQKLDSACVLSEKKEDTTNVELFRQSLIQGLSANVWEKADVA